ncbi:unnamed protein product [Plutella xylostella]|uniref:Phospholipase B-like n=1 Tax=Plutella xylostella TaxID=51655 RepID=A0A8S4FKZ0_PLUXY|nr:unnamed protein product [Plutella xylostella]
MATCRHILLAILWLLGTLTVCRGGIWAYVKWDAGGPQVGLADIEEEIPDEAVASGYYSNEINSTGWAYLEVKTSASAPDERQAYSAGVVEGYLTRDLIWYHWMNLLQDYCINKSSVCDMVEKFIDDNEDFVGRNLERNPEDPYWYQVKLFYIQLEGLAYGYNGATKNPDEKLSLRDVFWLNLLGDLDELAYALVVRHNGSAPAPDADERCTGLVKLLPDHSDLYVAHVTWNSYQSMLRVQKMYDLQYGATPSCREKLPGRRMTMSSYPGFVQSSDDFYVVSSGLVVAETTIGNTNASLFLEVQPEDSLFEFVRAMVASRLATSGEQWAWFFKRYNSGTYNNQWYIVDYTRFSPAAGRAPARLRRGLLWLLEQAPGYTASADM